jgi:hypothetical protein
VGSKNVPLIQLVSTRRFFQCFSIGAQFQKSSTLAFKLLLPYFGKHFIFDEQTIKLQQQQKI